MGLPRRQYVGHAVKRTEDSLWDPIEGQTQIGDFLGDPQNPFAQTANEPEPPAQEPNGAPLTWA